MTAKGIVFFAAGERYLGLAQTAAKRSMRYNDVPHLIFCSSPPTDGDVPVQLYTATKNVWMDRIACLARSPFEMTIYLDVDCHVLGTIMGLYDILSVYEIAAAHAPGYRGLPDPSVPEAFFELNCGVVAFRKSSGTDALFAMWRDLYRAWHHAPPVPGYDGSDQPTFRRAVWLSRLPLYVLGPEYNWRPAFPSFLAGRPKILHGYHDDPDAIAALAGQGSGARSFPTLIPHLTDLSAAVGEVS